MLRSTLLVSLLAFTASASAEGFNYTYAYLGYGNTDIDVIDSDGNGFAVGGSFAFTDSFHGFMSYDMAEVSLDGGGIIPDVDVDATRLKAGFGYNMGLTDAIDLIAKLSYEGVDLNPPGPGSADDSGYGLGVGMRFRAMDSLELGAGINHVSFSDFDDDTRFEVNGIYSFNDTWSLSLSGEFGSEISTYVLSGRFYFGG